MTVAKLIAVLVDGGKKSTYVLQFSAPESNNKTFAGPAKLVLGNGKVVDLGVIVAPTQATWRAMRSLTLVEDVPVAISGEEATLVWGPETLVANVMDGGHAKAASRPTVALLRVSNVPNSPLERKIELQVNDLGAGQRVRVDAGGSNQWEWEPKASTDTDASQEGAGYKVEWTAMYPKPGTYLVVVDLLDDEGFWVDELAEQEIEIAAPVEEPTLEGAALTDNSASFAPPAELVEAAATLPAWQPFRYARPAWAWARMYSQPGGTRVTRSLAVGTYLAIKAETLVSGVVWYQSTALDWIPASSVVMVTPSALRGVELSGTSTNPDPDPDPGPDPDPDPDPGDFPKGVVTANVLNVRSGAGISFPVIDQLLYNTQVTIYEQRAVSGATWYRIGNRRWVHSGWVRLLSSPQPEPQPTRRGLITADVLNVRSRPGVAPNNPPVGRLLKGEQVVIYEEQVLAGATWYRIGTDRWVHGGWVRLINASSDGEPADEGGPVSEAQVASAKMLPLGWVVSATLNVRAEPNTTSEIVGTVNKYDRLSIFETRVVAGQRWYRIGTNRWVLGTNVGVAKLKARPAAFRANEYWVAVNLREQTLVAYEGDKPVYAALVATGLPATPTVQGIFRTWWRLTWRKMSGGSAATGGYYNLEEVPWTAYFYSGYALHGAYWHDAFGRPRSHGCVNLSLYDSWWIFKWSEPGGKNSPGVYVYWE